MTVLTLAEAERACAAAQAKAQELGVSLSYAVVDAGGRLVLAKRGDGSPFLTIEWAQAKAVAAAAFGVPTRTVETWKADDPYFWHTATAATRTPMLPSEGAYPLRKNGVLVGAIACSGAAAGIDHQCAQAGAETLA